MSAHVPSLPFELDPLIAAAKRRARLRRVVAIAVVVVAGAAAGTAFALRAGHALGICAAPPSGWKEHTMPRTSTRVATVALTTFRFGQMDNFFGLASNLRWPANGVMVAVSNEGPDATPPFRHALRVASGDFTGLEWMRWPGANVAIRSQGRVLDAYVEMRAVTRATVAAANAALGGVHSCST